MNAVLFYVYPSFMLTGSTINAIEYFLATYERNKNFKLVLVNSTKTFKNRIRNIINERYCLRGVENYDGGIICYKKHELPRIKFNTVLVLDYSTIYHTRGIINTDKIIVISEKHTDLKEYFYDKSLYNVEYFGEMPFHYKDHKYRMKCLFDRFKVLRYEKEATYINIPRSENYLDAQECIPNLPRPIFFKKKTKHVENLFEEFSHYVYYHDDKWFDPHPRLFLECYFYGKYITYMNPYMVKDGSWYRYNDLLENGLKDRILNKNDDIIRELI